MVWIRRREYASQRALPRLLPQTDSSACHNSCPVTTNTHLQQGNWKDRLPIIDLLTKQDIHEIASSIVNALFWRIYKLCHRRKFCNRHGQKVQRTLMEWLSGFTQTFCNKHMSWRVCSIHSLKSFESWVLLTDGGNPFHLIAYKWGVSFYPPSPDQLPVLFDFLEQPAVAVPNWLNSLLRLAHGIFKFTSFNVRSLSVPEKDSRLKTDFKVDHFPKLINRDFPLAYHFTSICPFCRIHTTVIRVVKHGFFF